jgi:hypothetical protein
LSLLCQFFEESQGFFKSFLQKSQNPHAEVFPRTQNWCFFDFEIFEKTQNQGYSKIKELPHTGTNY